MSPSVSQPHCREKRRNLKLKLFMENEAFLFFPSYPLIQRDFEHFPRHANSFGFTRYFICTFYDFQLKKDIKSNCSTRQGMPLVRQPLTVWDWKKRRLRVLINYVIAIEAPDITLTIVSNILKLMYWFLDFNDSKKIRQITDKFWILDEFQITVFPLCPSSLIGIQCLSN